MAQFKAQSVYVLQQVLKSTVGRGGSDNLVNKVFAAVNEML